MIFVTVGTQLPFDRLIRAVDTWAVAKERMDVFAQVGPSGYRPQHIRSKGFIDAQEFRSLVSEATLMVAHAGMGSIITALEANKPIVVLPRRADLNEHRNDHQLATAKRFASLGVIHVAFDVQELVEHLSRLLEGGGTATSAQMGCRLKHNGCKLKEGGDCNMRSQGEACSSLLGNLRAFAQGRLVETAAACLQNLATQDRLPPSQNLSLRSDQQDPQLVDVISAHRFVAINQSARVQTGRSE